MSAEPDESIDGAELCQPLRGLQPSQAIRAANREAVAAVLNESRVTPWWQRSVEVPLPLAIATAAALLISTTVAVCVAQPSSVATVTADAQSPSPPPRAIAALDSRPAFVTRARYFPGVGFFDRETHYYEESVR